MLERTNIRSVGVEFFKSVELAIQDNQQMEEMVAVNQQNCDDLEDTINVTVHNQYVVEEINNRTNSLPNHT